jgi:hypothetical protein
MKEGLLQHVCCALVQEPPTTVADEVEGEMEHNYARTRETEDARRQDLREDAGASAALLYVAAIERAFQSFPRSSVAGSTGLRPQHLKKALTPGFRDEVFRHFVVGPWFSWASLIAIPQTSGDRRPVAVG